MGKQSIKQGDIILLTLDPSFGKEIKGKRPAIIISGNAFHYSGMIIVCPLTSTIREYPGNIILPPNKTNKLSKPSEVLGGQIKAVTQERITKVVCRISKPELKKILQGFDLVTDRSRRQGAV